MINSIPCKCILKWSFSGLAIRKRFLVGPDKLISKDMNTVFLYLVSKTICYCYVCMFQIDNGGRYT